ncbi:MAG: mannose-6-phosphate isomerase, class I [Clostridiales bacterium]|nr:mannose-6-phosphate isomerase, class I [Clostridiales bacterium]
MKEILFVEPVFKSMVWGGNRLKSEFGYTIPSDNTGECWAISAHKNGDCVIKEGNFKGKTLSWLWQNHRELFGDRDEKEFPLLVKIIDAKKDLSIQVHPDDAYALWKENSSWGKTECWYILDCKEDASIVIGHRAKDKEELRQMIEEEKWEELIRILPIKKGDFFQITPGTIHAIKEGTLLLETQQNSDITYRLYDYGRLDNGKPRQLHIKESIDVITCPHRDEEVGGRVVVKDMSELHELIRSKYYTVERLRLHGEEIFIQDKDFMNFSVIMGEGELDGRKLQKGDHFILPYNYGKFQLKGNIECIISYIE